MHVYAVINFIRIVIIKLWINEKFIYFSGYQQSIISFIKIKNLYQLNKNQRSLNCQYSCKCPKIQEPILPDFKKVGSY